MKTTIQIPSPIPYLMEVPDLRAHNTTYDWRLLFMLVLMGLGSGRTNLLAIAQWVQDQRDWLLSLGLGRRASGRALPAQATLYRFVWALEQQAAALEQALKQWTKAVWRVLQEQGQAKEQEWLALSLDGKHLKGSARRGVGDRALVLVSAYLRQLGLSLMQREVQGDEAVAGRRLVMALEADLAEFGIPWVLTGDAAHTETQTAAAVGALPARAQGEPGGVERLGRVCAEVSRRGGSPLPRGAKRCAVGLAGPPNHTVAAGGVF